MNPGPVPFSGICETGWEPVRAAIEANFASTGELGCSVAIFHRGRPVVDLVAGWTDQERSVPYTTDNLQVVFSTTKGIAATALAMCVDRGLVDYATPVSHYWPEFAAHGKDNITVAQLVSHQAGLYTIDEKLTLDEILDDARIARALADTKPRWEPGTAHGYHALTYGWLVGEIVRRVDGRDIGRFVNEEIAGPLGVELHIGLPDRHHHRVALLTQEKSKSSGGGETPEAKAARELIEKMLGPDTPGGQALSLSGMWTGEGLFNRPEVLRAQIPAAGGATNARSLATMYAALQQPVNGVRLLSPETFAAATAVQTPLNEPDKCLIVPTSFAMGYMTHSMFTQYAGPGSFGHPGFGGSVAFLNPERELAFGYAMNALAANLAGDTRAQAVIDSAVRCADAA
ncbi:MAG: esterase [Actinobacteria bacterium]|nr:esterase [Actinomycetota bacterium]NBP52727.1 esterase [Actinomycetota bacterium]